jgi:hypothetical protein
MAKSDKSDMLVFERRWNRKRQLLPNLRLRYPNNDELQKLAELAKVDNLPAFASHIRSIILDAHLNTRSLATLSAPTVQKILTRIASRAELLAKNLKALDVGGAGSAERAGLLIELELTNSELKNGTSSLPQCIGILEALSTSAQRGAATVKPRRGPKGAGGSPAFDIFVQSLLMAARQRKGVWTNFRKADQTWTGSLLKALEILKPYLPKGFFPRGELGRSLDYVRYKLKQHIAKNQ